MRSIQSLVKTRISLDHTSNVCPIYKVQSKRLGFVRSANSIDLTLKMAALRPYPPVPINTRFCKKATTLPRGGGLDGRSPILVWEGMPVAYSVYHMQSREDLYGADAGTF